MLTAWQKSKQWHPRRSSLAVVVILLALAAGYATVNSLSAQEPAKGSIHGAGDSSVSHDAGDIPLVVRVYFRPLPATMPGAEDDTPEMVALGRKLFFEPGISLNKSQACNDCHRLDVGQAGADGVATSKGAVGTFGTRNSPTVINAGFQAVQFWDGRAADLVEQAKGPVLNPVEMGMRTPQEVADRLKDRQEYRQYFQRAFPDQNEPVTFDNVARAIAAFERTLVAPARFDRYLRGQTDAITMEEKHGLHSFVDIGCVECHSSFPVGGRIMQKVGVYHPYPRPKDMGRYEVTKDEEDKFVFKVPMLRNVTRTSPYFHDGRTASLSEAVRIMARLQQDTELTASETSDIIAFLGTLEGIPPLMPDD